MDTVHFGEKKRGLLRRFRPFRDGTPAHDPLWEQPALGDGHGFRDDECCILTDPALTNFTTVKYITLDLMRRASNWDSLRLRCKVAA